MAGRPRISVLLPVRNGESTLAACLAGIVRQTEERWECVVIDDGSTDATADRVRAVAGADPRFRLLSRPQRGLVASLNEGVAACRGDYIARMDADDVMLRRRLAEQADLLDRRPDLVAAGCHVRLFPRRDLTDGSRKYERWLNGIGCERAVRREVFVECPVAHPTLMVRRATLAEAGYLDRGWPEDYDLVLRLLGRGLQIGVLPRRRLCWRRHAASLSRTSAAYSIERFTACKAHYLARGFLAGDPRFILWGHGGTGRALRRALAGHGKRPSHVVEVHPRRLGNRIDGAPVVPHTALPGLPRGRLVVSVAGAGARAEIRGHLAALGFVEGTDYVCAA